jgi:hypothetical protein
VQLVYKPQYFSGDRIEKNEMGGTYSTYGGKEEVYTGFWCGYLRDRDHSEGPGVDGKIILRWIFGKWDGMLWTGSIWLRMGIGHLWMWQ